MTNDICFSYTSCRTCHRLLPMSGVMQAWCIRVDSSAPRPNFAPDKATRTLWIIIIMHARIDKLLWYIVVIYIILLWVIVVVLHRERSSTPSVLLYATRCDIENRIIVLSQFSDSSYLALMMIVIIIIITVGGTMLYNTRVASIIT